VATQSTFAELVARLRRGDADAAAEVVRRYESEIRRAIRLRLTDTRLRRVLDSMDICQSVMANFFVRAAAGQFDLERPDQLLRLLVVMARNKLRDQVSHLHAARRDQRRLDPRGGETLHKTAEVAPTPSEVVAGRDLLQSVLGALTPEERLLAEQRAAGGDWNGIAKDRGETPDAVRKRLTRALDRVARQFGLEEVPDV
jgi:RNA polymerase sigma-70 factor (ECF subfamily)